jgi:hypothetical protein
MDLKKFLVSSFWFLVGSAGRTSTSGQQIGGELPEKV